ncbi:hypothetical protein SORBI_3004G168150 [Sorghum bicolor]|uniref:Uncharacterized protein n=1 Tax=Sorghum bicolor TaxID=4558 RepID=A0A1Z5RMV5_SORBI|nr:hypothetical protein SORBI_3004G168150 [Sorghum bicolor]
MWSLHTNIIHLCTDSMPHDPRFIVHTKQQAPPWLFLSYRIWPRPFRQQRLGSPAPSNGPAAPTTRPAAALLSRAVTDGSPGPTPGSDGSSLSSLVISGAASSPLACARSPRRLDVIHQLGRWWLIGRT